MRAECSRPPGILPSDHSIVGVCIQPHNVTNRVSNGSSEAMSVCAARTASIATRAWASVAGRGLQGHSNERRALLCHVRRLVRRKAHPPREGGSAALTGGRASVWGFGFYPCLISTRQIRAKDLEGRERGKTAPDVYFSFVFATLVYSTINNDKPHQGKNRTYTATVVRLFRGDSHNTYIATR